MTQPQAPARPLRTPARTRTITLTAAMLALAAGAAQAGASYGGLGTTGIELGYSHKLQPTLGVRADIGFMKLGRDFNNNGADYQADLKFSGLGAYVDYFLGSSFRLSGGVLLGRRTLEGVGVSKGGTVTINGTAYSAGAGERVTVKDTLPSTMPYLGLGFGHGQSAKGLGFYFDAGVALGKGDVSISVTPGLVAAAGQANIDAEEAKVRDTLDKLKAYPVIKLGVSYTY